MPIFAFGINSYIYDNEGNLTRKFNEITKEKVIYVYDHRNRLVNVVNYSESDVATQTVNYIYDFANHRVAKIVNQQITQYIYNGTHIWREISVDGKDAFYLVGDRTDQWLARQFTVSATPSSKLCWYLADRLDSVRGIASKDGFSLLTKSDYGAYGNIIAQTNPVIADQFGFTGREYDSETGLYYYRARYYNVKLGRFISEDPIRFGAGDFNLQRYVENQPTGFTDPSGLLLLERAPADFKAIQTQAQLGLPLFTAGSMFISVTQAFTTSITHHSAWLNQDTPDEAVSACMRSISEQAYIATVAETVLFRYFYGRALLAYAVDPSLENTLLLTAYTAVGYTAYGQIALTLGGGIKECLNIYTFPPPPSR